MTKNSSWKKLSSCFFSFWLAFCLFCFFARQNRRWLKLNTQGCVPLWWQTESPPPKKTHLVNSNCVWGQIFSFYPGNKENTHEAETQRNKRFPLPKIRWMRNVEEKWQDWLRNSVCYLPCPAEGLFEKSKPVMALFAWRIPHQNFHRKTTKKRWRKLDRKHLGFSGCYLRLSWYLFEKSGKVFQDHKSHNVKTFVADTRSGLFLLFNCAFGTIPLILGLGYFCRI